MYEINHGIENCFICVLISVVPITKCHILLISIYFKNIALNNAKHFKPGCQVSGRETRGGA